MRSPMIGFPLARGAALVDVTKGAVARFLRTASVSAWSCVDAVNATSVAARVPYLTRRTHRRVDLGPLCDLLRVLQLGRYSSPFRPASQLRHPVHQPSIRPAAVAADLDPACAANVDPVCSADPAVCFVAFAAVV